GPDLGAVLGAEAEDVVFGKVLVGGPFRPMGRGDEDVRAPDDRAGLVLIAFDLVGREERRLPEDVLLRLAAPGEGEVFLVAEPVACGAAPGGPVFAGAGG